MKDRIQIEDCYYSLLVFLTEFLGTLQRFKVFTLYERTLKYPTDGA